MRTLPLLLACTVLSTLACVDDGGGGGDIEPRAGVWDFSGGAPIDDTCGYPDLYTDPPGSFVLTNNGDGTFTITAGENVFDCNLDGASFSCPERLGGENDVGGGLGLDAVVEYTISVTGSFSSDTQMSGRQLFQITCNGADCATVEAAVGVMTPCGWAQDFTAQS